MILYSIYVDDNFIKNFKRGCLMSAYEERRVIRDFSKENDISPKGVTLRYREI